MKNRQIFPPLNDGVNATRLKASDVNSVDRGDSEACYSEPASAFNLAGTSGADFPAR